MYLMSSATLLRESGRAIWLFFFFVFVFFYFIFFILFIFLFYFFFFVVGGGWRWGWEGGGGGGSSFVHFLPDVNSCCFAGRRSMENVNCLPASALEHFTLFLFYFILFIFILLFVQLTKINSEISSLYAKTYFLWKKKNNKIIKYRNFNFIKISPDISCESYALKI